MPQDWPCNLPTEVDRQLFINLDFSKIIIVKCPFVFKNYFSKLVRGCQIFNITR